jgi:type II secretory pathway pseudopilin PulG
MTKPKTSTLAIFALVLAALFFIPGVPIAGGILGVVALRRIARSNGALGGRRIAIWAIVAGAVSGLFFQGILAAITIPNYVEFKSRARTSEAQTILYAIRAALSAYADENGTFPDGANAWVPAKPCCDEPEGRCPIDPASWGVSPWKDLGFQPYEATRFQYRYTKDPLPDGARVVVEAKGDPDCSGHGVVFDLVGEKHGTSPAEWSLPKAH